MAFDKKFSQYGVLKIEGNSVKVHSTETSYDLISVGEKVVNASWAGDFINVTLENGRVKRYSSTTYYNLI